MMRLAISGIDETTGGQLATRLQGATLVNSAGPGSRASSTECDAVALLRSGPALASVAEEWLAAKKHVLLASEACRSGDLLERLASAAQQSGSQLMIASLDRFLPSRQHIREQLDAGKLGVVGLVRSHRWMPAATSGLAHATAFPSALIRDLELAVSLVGWAPNVVFAASATLRDSNSAGRFIQTHLGFPGGAMALVDYCDRLPAGEGYQTLSLICESGAAYIDDQQNAQFQYSGGPAQAIRAEEGVRPLVNLVQSFVDGLAESRDFSGSIAAWRRALRIATAVSKSLESGQPVMLEGNA